MRSSFWAAVVLVPLFAANSRAEPPGYYKHVAIRNSTRLDWTVTVSPQSLESPLEEWKMDGYDSTKQSYDLLVPPGTRRQQASAAHSVHLAWRRTDRVHPIFGGVQQIPCAVRLPIGGGQQHPNAKADAHRSRHARRYTPQVQDRSGADLHRRPVRRRTCVLADCLQHARTLWRRLAGMCRWRTERGTMVAATGRRSFERGFSHRAKRIFNNAEINLYRGPLLRDVGVRTKIWVQPRMGHDIPPPLVVLEAFQWLEASLDARRALAKRYPASSCTDSPSREEASRALLAEGKSRLDDEKNALQWLDAIAWRDDTLQRAARR